MAPANPGPARPPSYDDAANRLAALVQWSADAITTHALDGTILTWNPGAESLYGYAAAEAVGQPLSLLVPFDQSGVTEMALDAIRSGTPVQRFETVWRSKSGKPVDVALTVAGIQRASGELGGFSITGHDLTEARWLAETLNVSLRVAESALADAKESEGRSRRFLADAAHQLRAPVTGIQACAEGLLAGPDDDQAERLLADLVRETVRAGRLMAGLLKVARLDQGQEMAFESCDIVALCCDEADRVWTFAPDLDIVMQVAELPDPKPTLDAGAVREIMANLLDNARRHAEREIRVEVSPAPGAVEVRVADDGAGIPVHLVESVFQRFVSLDDKGGSGLGLPIARGLARAHGGDVTYEDRAFVVRLRAGGPTSRDPGAGDSA